MSVSSHLTPEPERRLWLILEHVRSETARADLTLGALALVCGAETIGAAGPARAALAVAAAAALLALSPPARKPRRLPLLDPAPGRPTSDDSLISVRDIPKYALGDLILKMDRYLGGGISATQYYEDLVAEIAFESRLAARRRRLLTLALIPATLGQLLLLAR